MRTEWLSDAVPKVIITCVSGLLRRIEEMIVTTGSTKRRKAMLVLSVAATVVVIGAAFYTWLGHTLPFRKELPARLLPLDADTLITDFTFSHDFTGGSLKMSGKRLVRRGQRFFVVRSTLLKTTSFDDVSGVYTNKRNRVEFVAKKLEWELLLDKPLTLHDVDRLSINGTKMEKLRTVRMDLEKNVIRMYGRRVTTYLLDQ